MKNKRFCYNVALDSMTREEAVLLKAGFLAQRLLEQESYFDHVDESEANVVSSRITVDGSVHMPVLDIDFPAKLIPSSTEDHYHLYLDIEVPHEKYMKLLEVLAECGIISKGCAAASIARGATFVRKPGVLKDTSKKEPDSQ